MGVRKCCVCEGSIVNGRCRDCGMPYRRDEELYHLNENRRDHYKHASKEAREKLEKLERPLSRQADRGTVSRSSSASGSSTRQTGASSGREKRQRQKESENTAYQRRYSSAGRSGGISMSSRSRSRRSRLLIVVILVVAILGMLPGILSALSDIVDDISYSFQGSTQESYVMEEKLTSADVAPVGEYTVDFFDQTVTAGEYVIGQEIPAGIYTISLISDQGEVDLNLDDYENGLFEFLVFSHEEYDADYQVESFEGLALMEGGELRLEGAGTLNFYCEEAYYTQNWTQQENPMDISYEVESEMEVGTDLEPGVYDVVLEEGEGDLRIQRGDEYGFSLYLSSEADYGTREFRNLNLPEGTVLTLEEYGDVCNVSLRPSAVIYLEKENTQEESSETF